MSLGRYTNAYTDQSIFVPVCVNLTNTYTNRAFCVRVCVLPILVLTENLVDGKVTLRLHDEPAQEEAHSSQNHTLGG